MGISKELLSEVLKSQVEIIDIGECKCMIRNSIYFDNEQMGIAYRYLYGNKETRFMSIYEFAFKCKEWAKNKEYIIHSSPTQKIEHTAIVQSFDFNKFYYGENQFYALTEVEAIIKACEWILKEIKDK